MTITQSDQMGRLQLVQLDLVQHQFLPQAFLELEQGLAAHVVLGVQVAALNATPHLFLHHQLPLARLLFRK